ncbi:MAG TPA: discoidin domain-containing protein [Verrucomicrobiota bacterium]|nr:discoidin domain-containing protein [Verrucomicrobiota bacterium]HNU51341.1 discoidin domain-containing protein [Verrucomicrobiota bacterium]
MNRIPPILLLILLLTSGSTNATTASDQPMSLAGSWRFQLDRQDRGAAERWFDRSLPDTIRLPGSLQERGFGDDIATNTVWTGSLNDRSWFTADRYAPYRQPGAVKVPFWLQPRKSYVGVAWYQRDVTIPDAWRAKRLVVRLERAHWGTTLWWDDRPIGTQDALGTPHDYDLGTGIPPGRHRLTLRVDNRELVAVGSDAHSISDHTQGNWNGVAGHLELVATDPLWFADVRVFPDAATRQARVVIRLGNATSQPGSGTLECTARSLEGHTPSSAPLRVPIEWQAGGGDAEFTLDLGPKAPLWDEFQPALHELTLSVPGVVSPHRVRFGLRHVALDGKQITVNGRKIFLRGTLECCIFPQHGYPPTDVASWKRLLRVARAHGLNHLRFHSWCPPEAAFVAADEMGFYFQVECSAWSSQFNKGTPLDRWIYEESERIVAAYGNHPSFLILVTSNEPGGPGYERFLGQFVAHWKAKDPRRLYSAGSGWPAIPENDVDVTANSRAYPVHSAPNGRNDGDYRAFLAKSPRPVVSHEIGQYCVFPNLDEIPKYRGLLEARNFEIVRDLMVQAGLAHQAKDFLHASGRLQALFYKDEIEACLRTPGWAGFQLLDLHDFPGQGTALVGVLDAFWDEKGYIQPEAYRRFCDDTVPLVRLEKRLWSANETLRAVVEAAHFGAHDLEQADLRWRLRAAPGKTIAEGRFAPQNLPTGQLTTIGALAVCLHTLAQPAALNLEVRLQGTRFVNDWNLWAYPAAEPPPPPYNVTLTRDPEHALAALARGERVVLTPDLRLVAGRTVGRFDPIFWNRLWFPSQPQHTLGLLIQPKHPALARFPTASHSDWQWQDLHNHSKPMVLDALPRALEPIVQVIDDWNTCRKLGLIFEARVDQGRLLVCALDLDKDLDQRPAARQLRASLLDYASSRRFRPKSSLEPAALRTLFRALTPLEQLGARVRRADSQQSGFPAAQAIDGDPQTLWHTAWGDHAPAFPHELVIELNTPARLAGITLLPRQDGNRNGWIKRYQVLVSTNTTDSALPVAEGEFPANDALKTVTFATPIAARQLTLRALSGHTDGPWASLAELDLVLPASQP